tara:strand:+ start:1375 stop:2166 length:792 start_codon:yes stop_codon:yes gene_type:complete
MRFSPNKSLGQNFLEDKNIINLIVEHGNIKNQDTVFEVGPGTGNLTEKILNKSPKNLIVIEKDVKLANYLEEKFQNKIKIFNEDMMKFHFNNYYNQNLIIFGNLPYNISTQILAKWIKIQDLNNFCKRFILMFQKEVADRIIAKTNSKNYGRLSILSNWKMEIKKIIDVEPNSFNPSPKVRSSLLMLTPKPKFYKLKDPKNLEHITNIFFSQRRKMIKKPLKFLFRDYEEISKKLSLDLSLRPQNLDKLIYYKICEIYEKLIN